MPDCKQRVRQHVGRFGLDPHVEGEVAEEPAQELGMRCAHLMSDGLPLMPNPLRWRSSMTMSWSARFALRLPRRTRGRP
jgi:hypothetical protein